MSRVPVSNDLAKHKVHSGHVALDIVNYPFNGPVLKNNEDPKCPETEQQKEGNLGGT